MNYSKKRSAQRVAIGATKWIATPVLLLGLLVGTANAQDYRALSEMKVYDPSTSTTYTIPPDGSLVFKNDAYLTQFSILTDIAGDTATFTDPTDFAGVNKVQLLSSSQGSPDSAPNAVDANAEWGDKDGKSGDLDGDSDPITKSGGNPTTDKEDGSLTLAQQLANQSKFLTSAFAGNTTYGKIDLVEGQDTEDTGKFSTQFTFNQAAGKKIDHVFMFERGANSNFTIQAYDQNNNLIGVTKNFNSSSYVNLPPTSLQFNQSVKTGAYTQIDTTEVDNQQLGAIVLDFSNVLLSGQTIDHIVLSDLTGTGNGADIFGVGGLYANAIPEPIFYQMSVLFGCGGFALLRRRKK